MQYKKLVFLSIFFLILELTGFQELSHAEENPGFNFTGSYRVNCTFEIEGTLIHGIIGAEVKYEGMSLVVNAVMKNVSFPNDPHRQILQLPGFPQITFKAYTEGNRLEAPSITFTISDDQIPSDEKTPGIDNTKYIFKGSMTGIIADNGITFNGKMKFDVYINEQGKIQNFTTMSGTFEGYKIP